MSACSPSLGGVPAMIVCDNLKAAVTNPDRYDPGINRSYQEMARHYGTTVCPARPYKPRDKAKVEQSVLLVERWVLARLRNTRFFSLAELNAAITALTADLNARMMRGYGASRAELFAAVDAPALKPLPAAALRLRDLEALPGRARLSRRSRGLLVLGSLPADPRPRRCARHGSRTVEAFHKGRTGRQPCQVARAAQPRHPRRPHAERPSSATPPGRRRGSRPSPRRSVRPPPRLTQAIMIDRPHPEQGFRTCLGILSLEKIYGQARLEAACQRGALIKARSVGSIRSILKTGLDRAFLDPAPEPEPLRHGNIRGRSYFPLTSHPQDIPMLTHPTHDRLIALGLPGMARAFQEQRASPDLDALSFEERVGIMADREAAERDTKRVTARLKFASLRQDACVEDIDLRTPRGLDRALLG